MRSRAFSFIPSGRGGRRGGLSTEVSLLGRRKKLNLEKFLIFNQQFVTLMRAGLPILKSLDLLADRLTDPKLGPHIKTVRDEVRKGTLLSEAFRMQGVFPKIYVTSVMAGEKSGSLAEVLDRYIAYQKLALAVRKKIMVSLLYPSVLITLVLCLIVFLVTYVVPNFAQLYSSMSAQLPEITQILIAVGTTARNYVLLFFVGLVAAGFLFVMWSRQGIGQGEAGRGEDAHAGSGGHLAEVPGGAICARAEHAADRRHSAGAGPGDGRGFARYGAVAAFAREGGQDGAGRAGAIGFADSRRRSFPPWPST